MSRCDPRRCGRREGGDNTENGEFGYGRQLDAGAVIIDLITILEGGEYLYLMNRTRALIQPDTKFY